MLAIEFFIARTILQENVVMREHRAGSVRASRALSRQSAYLLSGGVVDLFARFRGKQPGNAPTILRGHTDKVLTVAFSANGEILASCGADKTVRLWSPRDPSAAAAVLRANTERILRLAL